MSANGAEGRLSGISVACTCAGTQAPPSFVCLHVWMSSLHLVEQTESRTEQSTHLHTSAVFICKTAAAKTSVFMGASSRSRHRCWDAPQTCLILCVFIFTSDN